MYNNYNIESVIQTTYPFIKNILFVDASKILDFIIQKNIYLKHSLKVTIFIVPIKSINDKTTTKKCFDNYFELYYFKITNILRKINNIEYDTEINSFSCFLRVF